MVHGSVCSFCVRLCGWTRSLCLSALPSDRAPDEVIRTVTGVARLHCLYLAGVSVVRCQIVFTVVVSHSLCQSSRSGGCSRLVAVQYSLKAGDSALPGLLHLHCRWYLHLHCVLESAPALPAYLHLHCVLELSNNICTICFSLAIGSRAFCTVTHHTSISQHMRYFWEIEESVWFCDLYSFRKHTNQRFEQISWVADSTTHSERQRFCSNTHTYLFTWAFCLLTTLFSQSVQPKCSSVHEDRQLG